MTESYFKGIDVLFVNPERSAPKDTTCGACGAQMTVTREMTYGSFAEAMSGHKYDYNVWRCPNTKREGHHELVELVWETWHMKGDVPRAMIEKEIKEKREKFLASKS